MKYTIQDFNMEYSNNDACLAHIWNWRYGKEYKCPECNTSGKFYKVKKRKVYACSCGYQINPMAGTIFHKSSTSLRSWFQAIYFMSQSKNGISAKELERLLGVAYRTAWRMTRQIRKMMSQSPSMLCGTVEADETYIGGKAKEFRGRGAKKKTPVVGMVQRGGTVKATAVINVKKSTVMPLIRRNVEIGTNLMTDEFKIYKSSEKSGYKHKTVNHSIKQYVKGDIYTNTIEGFWSQLKRSLHGTFHAVSPKYLQYYIDEFAFRYNYRIIDQHLFQTLLERI